MLRCDFVTSLFLLERNLILGTSLRNLIHVLSLFEIYPKFEVLSKHGRNIWN